MICLDSAFLSELCDFWFTNNPIAGINSHLIFAITTFIVSFILVMLNYILYKTKDIDLLKLSFNENIKGTKLIWHKVFRYFLWITGSFLISFILTTTEIINIKVISSVIVGFTWDKLFIQLNKMYGGGEPNPDNID